MLDQLASLLIVAGLIEAVAETVEWLFERGVNDDGTPKGFNRPRIVAVVAGLGLAFFFGLNVLELLGVQAPEGSPLAPIAPYVGAFLTGLLISRGATWFHDLIERLKGEPAPAAKS
jgi:hypothetical protein